VHRFGIPGVWLQGEVTPQSLSNASQSMASQAETDLAQADQLYDQAAQQWKSVDDVGINQPPRPSGAF